MVYNMIVGIGNDVIEIERIKKACEKEAFLARVYTKKEIEQSRNRMSFFAGNWAVKESVSKAFGTGVVGFDIRDIEVLRDEKGKPYVNIFNKANKIKEELNITHVHVSISDSDELVFATAIAESR